MGFIKKSKFIVRRFFWLLRYGMLLKNIHTSAYLLKNGEESRRTDIKGKPVVSIVIATYNNLEYTKQCVDSIYERTEYPDFEIIIVDNASLDGTVNYLKQLTAQNNNVTAIFNESNLGFAAANNQGILKSESDYIVFLNNDTIVTKGWLGGLIKHLDDPHVGMVGPVTNNVGNEAKIRVYYKDLIEMHCFAERFLERNKGKTRNIDMLALFCAAMRRATIDEIGLLDERFGIGMCEDNDYGRRLHIAGYKIICAQGVFVHHFGSMSLKQLSPEEYRKLHETNRKLYDDKWGIV
jgi:GT2 family glycosyltransferase